MIKENPNKNVIPACPESTPERFHTCLPAGRLEVTKKLDAGLRLPVYAFTA